MHTTISHYESADNEAIVHCPNASADELDAIGESLLAAGSVAEYRKARMARRLARRDAARAAELEARKRSEFVAECRELEARGISPLNEFTPEYIEEVTAKGWLVVSEG